MFCFCDSIETQRNGLVFIYDMTHSKYQNFDYELSIKILSMLKVRACFYTSSLLLVIVIFQFFGFLLILLCYFAFILSKVNLCMLCVFFVAGKLPSQIEKGADCYSSSVVQGAIQNPPSLCPGETA